MLINALYSIVDAYFIGGLGISQMGAVSVVFPISQQDQCFQQNNHNVIKIGIQALRANCVTFTLFGYVAINTWLESFFDTFNTLFLYQNHL